MIFLKETLPRWIANHLPRRIVYWSAIRLGVAASTEKYSSQIVPELTFTDAIQRWEL